MDGRVHLRRLATRPRPAGSEAERQARDYCAEVLHAAGFSVREEPFEYSAFPGRYATSLVGSAAVLALAGAWAGDRSARAWVPLAVLGGSLGVLGAAGTWLARHGVADLPVMRRRSVNLVATREPAHAAARRAHRDEPRVWLVAHLDSKSQPVPILARAAGITTLSLVWLAALGAGAAAWRGRDVGRWWPAVTGAGAAAGAPVVLSVVGARSPGAVDNASGVAAVLEAASALDPSLPVGVLITSAEELGLAGARLWVRGRRPGIAVNCDTVDDRGRLTVMYTGKRPNHLLRAMRLAAKATAGRVRAHRLLPGILTDGVAFADAGWQAVTISRGNARTLRRVHTPGDSLDRMRGDGIAEAARLIEGIVRRVCP